MRFESEQTIERSAADIWAYAADIARHTEWMSVTDAVVLDGDGRTAGTRGREGMNLGPMHLDVELELTPLGPTSTRAKYVAELQLRGFWRLVSPLLAMEGREGNKRELGRLKSVLEAG